MTYLSGDEQKIIQEAREEFLRLIAERKRAARGIMFGYTILLVLAFSFLEFKYAVALAFLGVVFAVGGYVELFMYEANLDKLDIDLKIKRGLFPK